MQIYFPDVPELPLPPGHRFPAGKYSMLLQKVTGDLRQGDLPARQATVLKLEKSPLASRADLLMAHDASYVNAVLDGSLSAAAQKQIGIPWSAVLRDRSLATVGGTLAAARSALDHGASGQLAGGTHHANSSGGSGFCTFNDLAVASLTLLAEKRVARIAIIDLDVHQGDGNALILGDNPAVFTLSMHGQNNFPFIKPPSTLDIGLADGTGDDDYLDRLDGALARVFAIGPELVLYIAGADPLASDRLGRLSLSLQGLAARDRMVFEACGWRGCPVAVVIGGGYADPITDTVAAYAQTFTILREVFETRARTAAQP